MTGVLPRKRRVGIVGFGHLGNKSCIFALLTSTGQYLVQAIQDQSDLELAFVWNRNSQAVKGKVNEKFILEDLTKVAESKPDLIVEVAHPSITEKYGREFLSVADYLIGSPTALANSEVEARLRQRANEGPHGLYIPSGALWGGNDIRKMADRGTLEGLKITMKKHPSCFKLNEPLKSKNEAVTDKAVVLYDGPVRNLCPLAPNNVNTMAAAAMAAHSLGFDGVQGCIVADPSLDCHIVGVDVLGPGSDDNRFSVKTVRSNPAKSGAVTGNATYASFLSSMIGAKGQGHGVHLC